MKPKNVKSRRGRSSDTLTPDNGEDVVLFLTLEDPNWSPVWDAALAAFMGFERSGLGWRWSGKHNSTLMAEALLTQTTIPRKVKAYLSSAMKPHLRWAGPVLLLKETGKKDLRSRMAELGRRLAIVEEYTAQKKRRVKTEAIAANICSKFGVERSYFFEVKKMSEKLIRDELLALIDPDLSKKN